MDVELKRGLVHPCATSGSLLHNQKVRSKLLTVRKSLRVLGLLQFNDLMLTNALCQYNHDERLAVLSTHPKSKLRACGH